jgi:hypothetical protein
MEVTDRVHIVAHGWEVARIVQPLYELKADKVVLILPDRVGYIADFEREMIADLEATERLAVETREANLYDLDSALQTFTQAVKDHEEDDVYINVTTGSSIAAIAGMMAAQNSDATPFFVLQETHEDNVSEDDHVGDVVTTGVQPPEEPIYPASDEISELPVFELQGPSSEQLVILGFLYGKDGVTKKELIQYAEDEQLPFIADTEAKSDEGRYRLLESHVIDPLTEGGYVRVEKVGRQKHVHLEERGVDALAAFPLEPEILENIEADEPGRYTHSLELISAPVDFADTGSFLQNRGREHMPFTRGDEES